MQQTEYVLWTVGGEEKTNDVFEFSYHFNDLMRNQTTKIFHHFPLRFFAYTTVSLETPI